MTDPTKDILDTLAAKFPRLSAGRTLVISLCMAAGLGYGAAVLIGGGEVRGLQNANSALKEQIELYKAKLQVGSPDEALKKLEELETRIKALQPKPDRKLTEDQRKALAESLKPFASEIKRVPVTYEGLPEQARFARDFIAVLEELHIATTGPFPGYGSLPTDKGILVGLLDPQKPSPVALKFIAALRQAGLTVSTTSWAGGWGNGDSDFDLFIAGQ